MHRLCVRIVAVLVGLIAAGSATNPADAESQSASDESTRLWMRDLLTTWESVCRMYLRVTPEPLPWLIFYDERQAYHLNADVAMLPAHKAVPATLMFAGRPQTLLSVPHDRALWVPGRESLPIGPGSAPYTFTAPYADGQKSFAVVALPSMVRRLPGGDKFTRLEEFWLGLAAHEMVHTRQIVDVMARIRKLRERHSVPQGIDDNFIEKFYGADPDYQRMHKQERDTLLRAALEKDAKPELSVRLLDEALALADRRRRTSFTGERAVHSDLDDTFLVMEGIGVWVQYQIARAQAPRDEPWQNTVAELLSRNTDWVQEEGLALFLLIDHLIPNWQPRFLAPDFPSPFDVLRETLAKRKAIPDSPAARR